MTKSTENIKKLNELYLSVLGRSVDQSGLDSYIGYMTSDHGVAAVRQTLLNSAEYRSSRTSFEGGFNSLAGDRVSYISCDDTSPLDSSKYGYLLDYLIKLILLIDYNYSEDKIQDRVATVKRSLIHINKSDSRFKILPHKETLFNTENFIDSLKDYNNIKYYILYICIINLWKDIFNKTVDTCQTKLFLNNLNNIRSTDLSFDNILDCVGNFFIDCLCIRIIGKVLPNQKKNELLRMLKNKQSSNLIEYLQNIDKDIRSEETKKIQDTINKLNVSLGRKPRVLIMIAYLETQNDYFLEKMMYHINKVKELNSNLDVEFALDNERIGKESTDYTPWSRVKRIRNLMINKYDIRQYDYLYIIDSDMIDYPHDFLGRAIGLNPNGITAPMALIQNSITFYDWCGYQKKGATSLDSPYADYILMLSVKDRNFNLLPPYVEDDARLVEIDCVGCTYVVPSKIFDLTYGDLQQELLKVFDIANVKNHKITENKVQYEDHPSFTDHYTICAATRANGGKIYMDRGSAAYHADLPIFGEKWH